MSIMSEASRRGHFLDIETPDAFQQKLTALLGEDLNFHNEESGYASHNFHSFPAKFPPQLPRKFISALTQPGEVVLDPMMGSGTTVLEAVLAGRQAIGIDIDPLALLISKVKVTPVDVLRVAFLGEFVSTQAALTIKERRSQIEAALQTRWDPKTKQFVDYWFTPETQIELMALSDQIRQVTDATSRAFLALALSSVIITKSGGVSLALDLGHTRPHRARVVVSRTGENLSHTTSCKTVLERGNVQYKMIRSPIADFKRRFRQNLNSLPEFGQSKVSPVLAFGNAQNLPLPDNSVSLIATSPPYASNAIDYMRAHKFSLVWIGHAIEDLSKKRKDYIGGEVVVDNDLEQLPPTTSEVVATIGRLDERKGRVLHRYYSEMTRTLREMHRVLKPGKVAIVVVGTSVMRGRNTEIASCLTEIGTKVGFDVPKVGVRSLDRDRRMLPVGSALNLDSQIQQRMHEEYVIGFLKPKAATGDL